MKTLLQVSFIVAFCAASCLAQTTTVVSTPPAGIFKLTARGASDSWLSLPLQPRPAGVGRVAAVGTQSITLVAPTDGGSAFVPESGRSYYLQFISGSLDGLCYPVVSVADNVVTLATQGDDLAQHPLGPIAAGAQGDRVRIRPFWTVSDVLGQSQATLRLSPVPQMHPILYTAGDEVRLPGLRALTAGETSESLAFVSELGWRARSAPDVDASGTVLPPGSAFVVRRQDEQPVDWFLLGYAPQGRFVLRLPAVSSDLDWEYGVAWAFPEEVQLGQCGLASADGVASLLRPTADLATAGDALWAFDAASPGFAQPPESRLAIFDGSWFDADAPASAYKLIPGRGYLLRLRGARPVSYWVQENKL